MSTSSHDRWLLPRRQTEFPLRDLLPEEILHPRREATFLALSMLAVLPVAVLVLGGASHVIDLSALVAPLGIDSSLALALPVGAAPFALGLLAVAIVCELFGRRRARALVVVAAVSAIALAGFVRLVDVVDGGTASGAALALATACVVAHVAHVIVFDALRRALRGRARFVRMVAAAVVACALGFTAFAGVAWLAADAAIARDAMAIAAGSAAWSFVLAAVLAIPAVIVVRALAVALRVGREMVVQRAMDPVAAPVVVERAPIASPAPVAGFERSARGTPAIGLDRVPRATGPGVGHAAARGLPPAVIVDEDVVPLEPEAVRRRGPRVSLQPFSSAEMAFFREGDELDTPT